MGLEDPSPEVTGGDGVSLIPDLVARMGQDRTWGHLQRGLLIRQLVGTELGGLR